MKQQKSYQANPVVSCGDEADGAILYNPDRDITSVINLTARGLWDYIHTPRTLNEMAAYLLDRYSGVSVEQATEDTELFIKNLSPDFLLEIKSVE